MDCCCRLWLLSGDWGSADKLGYKTANYTLTKECTSIHTCNWSSFLYNYSFVDFPHFRNVSYVNNMGKPKTNIHITTRYTKWHIRKAFYFIGIVPTLIQLLLLRRFHPLLYLYLRWQSGRERMSWEQVFGYFILSTVSLQLVSSTVGVVMCTSQQYVYGY